MMAAATTTPPTPEAPAEIPPEVSARKRRAVNVKHAKDRACRRIAEAVIGEPIESKTASELEAWAAKLAAGAPPLTAERLDHLRPLLASGR